MRTVLVLLAALLSGCASMDHQRVEGWPELDIVEHHVPAEKMLERCRKYVGFGSVPFACAEFNLAARRCDIWLNESFAPPTVVEHERLHCRGYDHVGSTGMARYLQYYLTGIGLQAAAGSSP